jgi:hypothetical protein
MPPRADADAAVGGVNGGQCLFNGTVLARAPPELPLMQNGASGPLVVAGRGVQVLGDLAGLLVVHEDR